MRHCQLLLALACAATLLVGCAKKPEPVIDLARLGPKPTLAAKPRAVLGETYVPLASADGFQEEGMAAWYGKELHGRKTANGEICNMYAMSAAHKTLPMGTWVRVTNPNNGKHVDVRVNDRGPFSHKRVIDVSFAAAKRIELDRLGHAPVLVQALAKLPDDIESGAVQGRFFVQIGSFPGERTAHALVEKMRQQGYHQTRLVAGNVSGRSVWRVQVGVYPGLGAADAAMRKLGRNFPDSFVIVD